MTVMQTIKLSQEEYVLLVESLQQYVADIKNVMEENDLTIRVDALVNKIKEQEV